ncbi:lytic transglycosylase domain-containing protein [Novosphingobium profundi]|uniref:lytic transglycosylase domain-containing protein n=1 Tax=Novosphingobium profundi TaxID=1774954 RepID=UPI003CCEDDDA
MGALKVLPSSLALLLALVPVEARPRGAAVESAATWQREITEAATRFELLESWIRKVMQAESGGHRARDGRPIRSPKGAMGLMQIMPATWQALRAELGLGADPDDPRDNILAGSWYLKTLYERFGYPGLFAAYNAGPARYQAYLEGRALPAETRAYLAAMGVETDGPAGREGEAASPLFVTLGGRGPDGDPASSQAEGAPNAEASRGESGGRDPLFAIRKDSTRAGKLSAVWSGEEERALNRESAP